MTRGMLSLAAGIVAASFAAGGVAAAQTGGSGTIRGHVRIGSAGVGDELLVGTIELHAPDRLHLDVEIEPRKDEPRSIRREVRVAQARTIFGRHDVEVAAIGIHQCDRTLI